LCLTAVWLGIMLHENVVAALNKLAGTLGVAPLTDA
jgi:hypothetical protein